MHKPDPCTWPGLVLSALLILLLTACSHGPKATETPAREDAQLSPESAAIDPAEAMRDHALRDLSRRLRVLVADIEVRAVESVTWSDGALGCPQPGFAYTQALVQGYRVVLAVGGAEYHYHGGSHGRPFLCPEDRRQPPLEAHREETL